MKDTKLYKLEIGRMDRKAGDVHNWMNRTVIAKDAAGAIKKADLHKSEYVIAVNFLSTVDVE